MAIESPRIAGQPSIERARIINTPIRIASVNPGETYSRIDPITGEVERFATLDPSFEGQVYFNVVPSGANRIALMYIAVSIGGILEWKTLAGDDFSSAYTGRPFDPMYD